MPSLAYMQGMQQGLERKEMIRRLQMEERKEKEQMAALQEKVDKARTMATLRGMPKEQANAMSVGELEGFNQTAMEREREAAREEGRQIGDRDNKAMAAAAMDWDALAPQVQQFFAQRTGAQPSMARQVYDQMGMGGRARAFGVTHGKTLEKADDYDREMAGKVLAGLQEKQKFDREAPGRAVAEAESQARTAQALGQTDEIARKGRTEEGVQLTRQRASAQDREFWRQQGHDVALPILHNGENGVVMAHTPGDVDDDGTPKWTKASPDMMTGMLSAGGAPATGDAAETAPPATGKEVRRKTKDGKVAVFDKATKAFLRYE